MQLMLRIGSSKDRVQKSFDADQAVRAYYDLAPYHKEYRPEPIVTRAPASRQIQPERQ